ncbi:hypothetical protein CC78DRAFT_535949 [Lojkania enalia]|uniref:Uncharacterized protein n=1 Tax=Lojkania enalia TaxID=147567 RepID=A0A9P4N104_9PLEO|nr:hypothetical protein CC78DRAFT_535949 [Didymosphaeria enalia]
MTDAFVECAPRPAGSTAIRERDPASLPRIPHSRQTSADANQGRLASITQSLDTAACPGPGRCHW